MSSIELSVIIPAYNAGKTIGRCLDSLLDKVKYISQIQFPGCRSGCRNADLHIPVAYAGDWLLCAACSAPARGV